MGGTLVDIFTDACFLIEIVASGTFTLEATEGVHTVTTLAQAWQFLALVNIFQDDSNGIGSEAFSSRTQGLVFSGVDGGTEFTGVSPGPSQGAATRCSGHAHTDLGAAGDAAVATRQRIQETVADTDINTAHSRGVELEVWRAVTQVVTGGVHTQSVDAVYWVRTLIDVSTVASAAVQLITVVTHATEHSRKVLAGSEHTDVLEVTLVDVLAGLAVLGGGEAHLALTAVPSWSIETLAILTQVHVVRTLIHI